MPQWRADLEEEESRPYSTLWKEAFPVGTEWDQYDKVYEIDWDFTNLEQEFSQGGKLHNQRVYLFGCKEPQLLHFAHHSRVIHIPAVVAVTSPFPPSGKIGIKSVQREEELIVPMKEMKMDWIPDLPPDLAVERVKAPQIFTLKCMQRRAALKQLYQERIKKYEYCLPYIDSPLKEDQSIDETAVSIMYPFEDEVTPPVVCEFDWDFDDFEEFVSNLVSEEVLLDSEREKFMAFLKDRVRIEKKKVKEAKQAKRKAMEEMSQDLRQGFQNMKFFKFTQFGARSIPRLRKRKARSLIGIMAGRRMSCKMEEQWSCEDFIQSQSRWFRSEIIPDNSWRSCFPD